MSGRPSRGRDGGAGVVTVALPSPVVRRPADPLSGLDVRALEADLRRSVDGEVRFDDGTRAAYSTDGSNFRQVPVGVVVPRSVEAAVGAVAACRRHGAPLLSRGGGTSLAGQCTNAAVVIDWSKHCNRLVSVDPGARRCVVEPGIVLDELNRQLARHGLRYGPEPATHPNCTLGGMIGNNSCGATAQRTGKVVDNTPRLEVLCYDGTRFWCGPTSDEEYAAIASGEGGRAEIYRRLRALRDRYAEEVRRRYPDIPRRVSGYNLDSLLPEHGFDLAGLLVGSESTLVTVLHAELALVPVLKARTLVVLGYPDVARAGDAVPAILPYEPAALEGLDDRLIGDERRKHMNAKSLEQLPEGCGWLMVQFGAERPEETEAAAHALLAGLRETEHDPHVSFFDDPAIEDELWQVRESGLGATAHVPGERDTWEGWEDSAVAPERLGAYLRDLESLYEEFGYAGDTAPALYGHFGQGCVHTRIPFDLYSDGGVATYKRFLGRAADLVVSYGGSLSGEHGDGQGRGALLVKMFGQELIGAFGQLKAIFDPDDRMNPGKLVAPYQPDENLRLGGSWSPADPGPLFFSYPEDDGSFVKAANRCVGVGRCRQHVSEGSVMCPSYQATLEEEDATRGRGRLLFEMLDGHGDGPVRDGWRSKAVLGALDLCLACKGCKRDCPVNVDMATYKAEFLAHHYAGRLRPRHHYTMGWLPLASQAIGRLRLGPAFNAAGAGPLRRLLTAAAGIEDRQLPLFAGESLQAWSARRRSVPADPAAVTEGASRGEVLLWPDTFTNFFHPHIGKAAVEVLEAAGWRVSIPSGPLCCGLTWISTGQLATARRVLARTADKLADHLERGGLVVGLEPSCTAVFRSDGAELLAHDRAIRRLRDQTVTFAELLTRHTPGWRPPQLAGHPKVLAQAHCHQHAVLGWDADAELLSAIGADAERLDSGCCGLAGNFGFEPGHLEVSRACAERVLMPRVRRAAADEVVLADGFSCRTQIHELGSGCREAVHLAELVAGALGVGTGALGSASALPEARYAERPQAPSSLARLASGAAVAGALAAGAAAGAAQLSRRRPPARARR